MALIPVYNTDRTRLRSQPRTRNSKRPRTHLNHFLGVHTREWVDGLTLNVQVILGQHDGPTILGVPGTVERTAQHLLRDGHLQHVARKLAVRPGVVNTIRTLKHLSERSVSQATSGTSQDKNHRNWPKKQACHRYLHDGAAATDFQHLTLTDFPITQRNVHDFSVTRRLHPHGDPPQQARASEGFWQHNPKHQARFTLTLSKITRGPFTPEIVE
jgi:hypothetical protein